MGRPRIPTPPDVISAWSHEYTIDGRTVDEIAEASRVKPNLVRRRMIEAGVPMRSQGDHKPKTGSGVSSTAPAPTASSPSMPLHASNLGGTDL